MTWLAVVLSVFLFYRYVERPHKILTAKIAGALAVIGCVVFGALLIHYNWREKRRSSEIQVTFHRLTVGDEVRRKVLLTSAVQSLTDGSYFEKFKGEDLQTVLSAIYGSEWVGEKPWQKYQKAEYRVPIDMGEEVSAHEAASGSPITTATAKRDLQSMELKRAEEAGSLLKSLRAKPKTDLHDFLFARFLTESIASFRSEEASRKYRQLITAEELSRAELINRSVELAWDMLAVLVNSAEKTDTTVSFLVCNNRDVDLESYSFFVSGFARGRSTSIPIRRSETGGFSTAFKGDIIIKPKTCKIIEWTGDYKLFPRYEIMKLIMGNWRE